MRIFVAAGVVFEGSLRDREAVDLWLHHYRVMCYGLRLAREAGDFGEIVKWELGVADRVWPEWFLVEDRGCDRDAVERFMLAEKRFVLKRTEQCAWCWYGTKAMPDEVRHAPGSNSWPTEGISISYPRPDGKRGWFYLRPCGGREPTEPPVDAWKPTQWIAIAPGVTIRERDKPSVSQFQKQMLQAFRGVVDRNGDLRRATDTWISDWLDLLYACGARFSFHTTADFVESEMRLVKSRALLEKSCANDVTR